MGVIFNESKKIGNFVAHMKIQEVPKNDNRPDGFKVNFVLVNLETMEPMLIIDNHKPFGYHIHSDVNDHSNRIELQVSGPYEALDLFIKRVKEITNG